MSSISIVAGLGKLSATVGNSDQRFRAAIKPLSVPATFFGERDGPEPGLPSEVRPDARIVTEISQFCHKLVSLRLFATAQGLLNGSPANYLHAAGEADPENLPGEKLTSLKRERGMRSIQKTFLKWLRLLLAPA